MTTAMKELYAFLDVWQVDDNGQRHRPLPTAYPKRPSPWRPRRADPHRRDARSHEPELHALVRPRRRDRRICRSRDASEDPVTYAPSAITLHYLLYGSLDNRKGVDRCRLRRLRRARPPRRRSRAGDFTDWTMVTIRPPNSGEAVDGVLRISRRCEPPPSSCCRYPRVGFFSTPAFFANWQTNTSNQMRVTTNQALIVATGSRSTAPTRPLPPSAPGLDAAHSNAGRLLHCHKVLDPTRSILSATYSWNYHDQLDPTWTEQPGSSRSSGVIEPVRTMADFGSELAKHPLFASGMGAEALLLRRTRAVRRRRTRFQQLVGALPGLE